MIRFVVDCGENTQYGYYQECCADFSMHKHRFYLTPDFIGVSCRYTNRLLGIDDDSIDPKKEHFTTTEVEEHINMAVLRVVRLFL